MTTTGRAVADAVARDLGGEVRALPTDGCKEFVIVVAGGRAPVLVREFPASLGACVPSGPAIVDGAANFDAPRISEIVEGAKAWLAKRDVAVVSMYGIAVALLDAFTAQLDEAWLAHTPGTADPTELWLSSPQRDAGSVGVFPAKIVIWIGTSARSFSLTTLAEVATALPSILAAVREQRARFERHIAASARIRTAAAELTAKLAERTKLPTTVVHGGFVRHDSSEHATITCGTRRVVIDMIDDEIRVHAGLVGKSGFACKLDELDADFDHVFSQIVSALAEARARLTVGDLRVRARYRVIDDWKGLPAGDEVTFVGLDDIDNHYGEYQFDTTDGQRIIVGGDCSHPETGPLSEVHLYLERVE